VNTRAQAGPLAGLCEICRERDSLNAQAPNFTSHHGERLAAAPDQRHLCAAARQRQRDPTPNAGAAASDQRCMSRERPQSFPSFWARMNAIRSDPRIALIYANIEIGFRIIRVIRGFGLGATCRRSERQR
jgi:hypothetical protein